MADIPIKNIKASGIIQSPVYLSKLANGKSVENYEQYFHLQYFKRIQSALGHNSWGVWFRQIEELSPIFLIDIYTENHRDASIITGIILEKRSVEIEFDIIPRYWGFQQYLAENDGE